jgi:hypothetical protein
MSSKEIYVSTDVEADGPIPGPNSMLSFGSVRRVAARVKNRRFSGQRLRWAIKPGEGLSASQQSRPQSKDIGPGSNSCRV